MPDAPPYKRRVLSLEPGPGIQAIRTGDWHWWGCAGTDTIPNAYQITRPGYVLTFAHSNEPHIRPDFFVAAISADGRPLTVQGPSVTLLDLGIGWPRRALEALNVTVTHIAFGNEDQGTLAFDVRDASAIGHEELRYANQWMDCVEVDGP